MKKLIILMFVAVFPIFITSNSFAESLSFNYDGMTHEYTGSIYNISINEEIVNTSVPSVILNNRTLVPARAIFEKLGAKIEWDGVNKKIHVSLNGSNIELRINDKSALVNNNVINMDVPPKIINDTTMLPVRFVAEQLNMKVEWKPESKIININTISGETQTKVETKTEEINNVVFTTVNETMYTTTALNIRTGPGTEYEKIGLTEANQAINRTAIGENGWSRIMYKGKVAYCSSKYLRKEYQTVVIGETLDEKIKNYLGNKINSLGMVYYDLTTGEKYEINQDNKYLAASTVKVQLNMLVYDRVRQGKLKLSDTIAYKSSFYEGGTGILQNQNLSKPLEVQMLLDYAIKYSDNIATNMLISIFGAGVNMRKEINTMFGIDMDTSGNYITPNAEYTILKNLYDNRENENYAHLIDTMKNTIFHDRIDKYIPQDMVAHKIGNYGSYVNDVGIIFTEKPYTLVVYTNGTSNSNETIAKVSQIIYDYHNSK